MELSRYFIRKTRDDGTTFVSLSDDRPEWLHDAVMDAHDGEMPNDWRYETCESIVSELADGYDPYEIADGLVDVYNADRAAWIADNLSRGCIDIDTDQLGDSADAFTVIGLQQYETIAQMVDILAEAIAENMGDES